MKINVLFTVLGLQVLFFQNLYCYIDPGLGSMVFQMLIAGLVTVIYLIKVFWKQIKLFLSHRVKNPIKIFLKRK